MALSNIEKHYNKHPEDLRLQRRHGIVEFETTMYHLRRLLRPGMLLLDIGAGTGRYASALMAEGYKVKAVELVRRNIEVFRQCDPEADVVQGDARDLAFIPSSSAAPRSCWARSTISSARRRNSRRCVRPDG